ncbi:helix-turn-helix domain-containing protein [Nonomuraea sp. B12E4]|uniref:winged helix-turn-helix transcriptional regulator n=1 Tax=Nonomuraea sp. B12E4 TaxID=3153564 RepID=UPI00325F848E
MALGKNYTAQDCSLAKALEVIGERWTLLVVRDAMYGVRRYSDFLARLDIPRAVLSQRLATLVDAGVLAKHRYQDSPPRDEYMMTPMGAELFPVIVTLSRWGERHLTTSGPSRYFLHRQCGTQLEPSARCPACDVQVPARDVEMLPGPGLSGLRSDPVSKALQKPHRLLDPIG